LAKPLMSWFDKAYRLVEKKPWIRKVIVSALIILFMGLGIYVRILPAINNGLELHESDPWIEYWQANYTYTHGLLSWYTLTRNNPDTHIFWYPWGRDFVTTSYPGLPIWTALTYPFVQPLGLSLKDWVILQPVIWAFLSFITLLLAVKELSRGNIYAILASIALFALVPSSADRNIAGFVEKEGVAITFIYLYIYFYSKLAKVINDNSVRGRVKLAYAWLSALSLAMVGWFWGGYIYVFSALIAFILLYPLFNPKNITWNYLKYHYILIFTSILFVSLSPAVLGSLGIYPFKIKSIGVILVAGGVGLPTLFYLLHSKYRSVGLKKPLLNPFRYFILLVFIVITGLALYALGYISISARYAWALGLRAITPAPPLVQSVEEHQSPLYSPGMVQNMIVSWGSGIPWLLIFSPLVLAIIGAFYLIYRGGMDEIYVAVAFILGFYSYLNAAYMEATASSMGLIVAGVFLGYIVSKIFPTQQEIVEWRKARVRGKTGSGYWVLALLLTILVGVNVAYSYIGAVEEHGRMVYSIMAGGTPFALRNDAWYKAIDFIKKNISSNAVIVAWWDYGYWISVNAGRRTVADGATLNNTQISILGRILTAKTTEEALSLMKQLYLPPNDTYILVYDVFVFYPDNTTPNGYVVVPYGLNGIVDIPKSQWMIRIGGRDIAEYLYLYKLGDRVFIAPRFDQPDSLGLIYKIMVDGILYLNNVWENKTIRFAWYSGTPQPLDSTIKMRLRGSDLENLQQITVSSASGPHVLGVSDRPFKNDRYIKPYMIIAEPFETTAGGTMLMEIIFIYKVTIE